MHRIHAFRVVVFPAPFFPINPMISPFCTNKLRLLTAILLPYCLEKLTILSISFSLILNYFEI